MAFFALSLIDVEQRRSYPTAVEQVIRSEAEKAASQAKKKARKKKAKKSATGAKKAGRPKGSRNRDKTQVVWTPVTNAANLSLFMVNVAQVLMRHFRQQYADFNVLDLKALFRGHKYVAETLKLLPEKPEPILMSHIFEQVSQLGSIHYAPPSSTPT